MFRSAPFVLMLLAALAAPASPRAKGPVMPAPVVQAAPPEGAPADAAAAAADPTMGHADSAVEDSIEAEYRAAFFYSLSCLAAMSGDAKDQAALLEKAQESDPSSALLLEERGDAAVALGQISAAADLLKQALAQDPKNLDLRRKLSRVLQDADRMPEARALFLKPDGSDPDDPDFLRNLVGLDFVQEDLPSAERRLRALLAAGGSTDDRELLGLALQRRQHWGDAVAEYRQVVAADATRSSTWARLAECEESEGDTPASKADLLLGLKTNPDSPLLSDQLGRLLYRLDDYAGAEAAFSRLVDRDPTDAHSLLYRGLSRLKTGRFKEAEADFTALGGLQKDDPDQGYALALALMMQKKYAQAEDELRKVLALNPQAEAAWAQLAFVYEREKKPSDAVGALRQGLKLLPTSEELALLLSAEQEDQGDLAGAEQALRDSLRHGGGDEIRFQLAVILDKRGEFPLAEKELSDLIVESPKHAQALNYLGYSWADRGEKLDQAEALIRRALALDPGNRYYLDSLGWTLYKEGRQKEAFEPLSRAAQGMADSSDSDEAVVFDHLAAVEKDLGQLSASADSKAKADAIRARSAARPAGDADSDSDPGKEPGL
jgi:tetratricopeptide (TPR) repeat protein